MTSYSAPKCFSCKFYRSGPTRVGSSGSCSKYKQIPKNIYYQAGDCVYYKTDMK